MANAVSVQVPGVPFTSIARAFHFDPSASGYESVIETSLDPPPNTRAPPPITCLPAGQPALTVFGEPESVDVEASARCSPLTPDGPGGPAGPVGTSPGLKSRLRSVRFLMSNGMTVTVRVSLA